LRFDPNQPHAAAVNRTLAALNLLLAEQRISYTPWCKYGDYRPLHPVCYALFHLDADGTWSHGRIYTGAAGHQALRKEERPTVRINELPTVELDYGALHPRMCYHLSGLEAPAKPYCLWATTTDAARAVAKRVVNAALNAQTPQAAIAACNLALAPYVKGKGKGKGKKPNPKYAPGFAKAVDETQLNVKDVYTQALRHHAAIAPWFGSDAGVRLMTLDAEIALDVVGYFTAEGIPCLPVHDSFIVPYQYADLLRHKMRDFYRRRLNDFEPKITPE
jgi:hypothetical protein